LEGELFAVIAFRPIGEVSIFIGYIEQLLRSGEFDGFGEELLFNFLVPEFHNVGILHFFD
jgi:hypothetical protein